MTHLGFPVPQFHRPSCISVLIVLLAMSCATAVGARAADLSDLEEVLLQNVRNGFVDYDGVGADPRFARFVADLAETGAGSGDSDGGLSFYINAYNALAIQGILDGASPKTWWGRRKFFGGEKYKVRGESITLETIEHERIAEYGDPRIHFAIVCASLSCPRLSSRVYRPESVNVQLHDAARRFVNDPTRNRFDAERRIAFVSRIFDWYADDFAEAGGSVQKYIARFIDDAAVQEALRKDEFELRYEAYDWNLNGYFGRISR